MSDNFQKLPLQQNLNAMATNRALAMIERMGQALPCQVTAVNGSIVTVTFEVQGGPWTLPPLTLPKAESQWLRAPTQVGDFGMTVPADTYLGGVSGYGGVADLTVDYGNLSTLVWVPVGSKAFSAPPDPNKAWINGIAGALLSDTAQTASAEVAENSVTITAAGNTLVLNSTGLTITIGSKSWSFGSSGFTDDAGIVLDSHIHGGVETGSGVSGPPEA